MEEKDVVHVKKLIINTDMDSTLAERMFLTVHLEI